MSRSAVFTIALGFLLMLSTGCSVEKKSEDFGYDYSINGCRDAHRFDSKEAYCNGLKSESLNQYCTKESRLAAFQANCGGDFYAIDAATELESSSTSTDL